MSEVLMIDGIVVFDGTHTVWLNALGLKETAYILYDCHFNPYATYAKAYARGKK